MIIRIFGRCFCFLVKVVNNIIIIVILCNLELRVCMVDIIIKKRGNGKERIEKIVWKWKDIIILLNMFNGDFIYSIEFEWFVKEYKYRLLEIV